jgi:hypothetical protein
MDVILPTFKRKGLSLLLLKRIAKHSPFVLEAQLKGGVYVTTPHEFDEALADLKTEGYIEPGSTASLKISELGRRFLAEFDLYAQSEIVQGNLIFALLKFIVAVDDPIHLEAFPIGMINAAPQKYYGGSAENLDHFMEFDLEMRQYITVSRDGRFNITPAGQFRYEFESKKRTPTMTLEDYSNVVLRELSKECDFVATILNRHGLTDSSLIDGIEAQLTQNGSIRLTNSGAYLTSEGKARLARSRLGGPTHSAAIVNNNYFTTYGNNSPVATDGAVSFLTVENKNLVAEESGSGEKKALTVGRWQLWVAIIVGALTILFSILALRH